MAVKNQILEVAICWRRFFFVTIVTQLSSGIRQAAGRSHGWRSAVGLRTARTAGTPRLGEARDLVK